MSLYGHSIRLFAISSSMVVGSAVVGRAFLLQTVVPRIVVQQSVVGSAVVARAAVEPNWDLHISPARSGKRRPMSQRGTSFGTNIEGLCQTCLAHVSVLKACFPPSID
jgi:hypothetical protein